MATDNPRVWFKSISLENVRSFGKKQTIYFTEDGTENGKAAQWNIILGDNGTGKTTVLKGLAIGVNSARGGQAFLDKNYEYLCRSDSEFPKINVGFINQNGISQEYWLSFSRIRHSPKINSSVYPHHSHTIEVFHTVYDEFVRTQLFAYGAARKMSEGVLTSNENDYLYSNHTRIESLFDESMFLSNAEEWLIQADYVDYKNKESDSRFHLVQKMLLKLFRNEATEIFIAIESRIPKVYLKTHYGDVRLHELSLGYKTLIAWMVDFAKGLLDRYPDSPDPLAEPAVCLVDEIDLHLHPKFQRTIIKFLTETFPNTQFIVTAHSPLIVVAAEERPLDANIILLKREGNETVVVNEPVDVSKWSVDQILNSDLFGYVPPTSETLTESRNERDALLAKPKLTKKEHARLTELDEEIGFVPVGRDQTEIKAETIIQQLADVLRNRQGVQ